MHTLTFQSLFKTLKMKSKLLMFFVLLSIFSCSKDDVNKLEVSSKEYVNTITNYYENWRSDLRSENGILIFKSWDHFNTTNEELILMDYEEVLAFENELNFYSQRTLLDKIIFEEEKLTDQFYAPYADLSDEEITALNLTEPRTEIYLNAVDKGLITVEEDSDVAHVYHLSVVDPTAARLINLDGFIMIDNVLWQYTDSQIKYCKTCTINDIALLGKAEITSDDQNIVTFTINNGSRNTCNWDGNLNKGWTDVESKRRARYERHGYSSTSDNCDHCFMIVKYYLHNEAQRKRWGKWKYRSSYKPWFRWDGSWSGNGNYWFCTNDPGAPPSYQNFTIPLSGFTVPLGVTATPMSNRRHSGNNNTDVKLHPHSDGQWPPPPNNYPPYNASKCWGSCLNVYSISIDGKIVHSYSNPSTKKDLPDG